MADDIPPPTISQEDLLLVQQLREEVGVVSSMLSDMDCLRFLTARKMKIPQAAEMVNNWYSWRHTELDPLPPYESELEMTPTTLLFFPRPIDLHPESHLLPTTHHGFDLEGRPIYWEKTGQIQASMAKVKEHFTNNEFHIMSQEIFQIRCEYASKKFGHHVHQCVVIFDMDGISASLDMDSIYYVKNILKIDQDYYPERLHKLILINSPWYFPAIFNLFYYLIDARTREKIVVLGSDFLSTLSEMIDTSVIPEEYGGECGVGGETGVHWDLKFPESTGCSRNQIEKSARDSLLRHSDHLTPKEAVNTFKALRMSGFKDDALKVYEKLKSVVNEFDCEKQEAMKEALKTIDELRAEDA